MAILHSMISGLGHRYYLAYLPCKQMPTPPSAGAERCVCCVSVSVVSNIYLDSWPCGGNMSVFGHQTVTTVCIVFGALSGRKVCLVCIDVFMFEDEKSQQ